MQMTKRDAAAEQIDQAIRLLREGYLASAVTLAGAAEDSMPATSEATLFHWLKSNGAEVLGVTESAVVSKYLNFARDWLKHDRPEAEIDLAPAESLFMIARAWSKFIMVYGESAQTEIMIEAAAQMSGSIQGYLKPLSDALTRLGSPR